MTRFAATLVLLIALSFGTGGHVAALEAPDSEFNEANGTLETAYIRTVGGQQDISYLIEEESSRTIEAVSDNTVDEVGWSEYDDVLETWSSVSLEDYSSDSVEDARDRIRDEVLGN